MYGKLLDFGHAPYKFEDASDDSFYITLLNKGDKKTYWSLGLEDTLAHANLEIGDKAKFTFDRKETVILKGGKTSHRSYFSAVKVDKSESQKSKSLSTTTKKKSKKQKRKNRRNAKIIKSIIAIVFLMFFFLLCFAFSL
jgi:hypothetical protein